MVDEELGEISVSKTITELMDEIIGEFCTEYCKYPDICSAEKKDPDDAEALLYEKYCGSCPFQKI